MFYSQFILAKKGPLGTIWIAAHLERKLRKNQVADTDIGVSVDSILFPDVPIALRLSSHLLLGVVRIYSRKVNYLFDDCSEALLKVKQAFRSTAVDLPPEESTAPYHSITLPETFDLDDFELPDSEIYQGNYVDHHVSSKEQITLQDTMEGVVYTTSQFGLDERFGDGDASHIGLELDEELFLDKVTIKEHDGVSGNDPLTPAQPLTPLEMKDESNEGLNDTLNQTEVLAEPGNTKAVEYAQVPSTPGLVEELKLPSILEPMACDGPLEFEALESEKNASNTSDLYHGDGTTPNWNQKFPSVVEPMACDGPLESENVDVTELEALGSARNASSNSDCNHGDGSTSNWSFSNGLQHHPEENGHTSGDLETKQVKPELRSPSIAMNIEPMLEEGSTRDLGPATGEDACNGVVINNEPSTLSVDQMDETVASPSCSGVTLHLEDPGQQTPPNNSFAQTSESCVADGEASPKPISNLVELLLPDKAVAVDAVCLQESPGRPEVIDAEFQACQEPKDLQTWNHISQEETPTEKPLQGEAVDDVKQASDKNEISELSQSDYRNSDQQHDKDILNETLSDDLNKSTASNLPAPEKLLSVPDSLIDKPTNFLVESTPDKNNLNGSDEGGVGNKAVSGKKRSFTESTVTVQSLNSVESVGPTLSKRITDSIPDDDDLLSSILVGRRSSVLKMKPSPPVPARTSTKRTRNALRTSSTPKRKVLMDEIMVLHGDTIREQLINTEDIRRVRKKAPCTRPEISMIQREFLEDEIFSEPICIGMSPELISLHGEAFDLSGIRVSEKDQDNASSVVVKDLESAGRPNVAEESGADRNTESVRVGNDGETQLGDIPIQKENLQAEELNLGSPDIHSQEKAVDITDNMDPKGDFVEMDIERGNADKCEDRDVSFEKILDDQPDQLVAEDIFTVNINNMVGLDTIVDADHGDEITKDVHIDCSEATSTLVPPENSDQHVEESGNVMLGDFNEAGVTVEGLGCDAKDPSSSCMNNEEAKKSPTYSGGLDVDVKRPSFNDGENSGCPEIADPQTVVEGEITVVDYPAMEDRGDFEDITLATDTEFLNVDDDEVGEEDDEGMQCAEDTRLLENSRWSSRTRAVAKYLQILFDREAVHGRKVLAVDNLLINKTRKEASRMFFESLVLKTKDFIHVEQAKPFDNIDIKPRVKLMKSNF